MNIEIKLDMSTYKDFLDLCTEEDISISDKVLQLIDDYMSDDE